jgi:hypothetical protein
VAKGFHQQDRIDYLETYSLIIKPTMVRLVLSIAISSSWSLRQIDIPNAFLHGNLSEEVYMSQPPGYTHSRFLNHVCCLKKAFYGLKQAPRAWFSRLSNKLLEFGFRTSKSDTSLFIYKCIACTIYVLIYVDDIIITSLVPLEIDSLLHSMTFEFTIKDLGELNFFLGIEVARLQDGIHLSQHHYMLDILQRTKMVDAKLVCTLMSTFVILSAFDGEVFSDPILY